MERHTSHPNIHRKFYENPTTLKRVIANVKKFLSSSSSKSSAEGGEGEGYHERILKVLLNGTNIIHNTFKKNLSFGGGNSTRELKKFF